MDVDPTKFRLRAFEHNFVKPIQSYLERDPLLEEHAQNTLFWRSLVAGASNPAKVIEDVAASDGLMLAALLAEAAEWIRIGLDLGYFSSEITPIPIFFGEVDFHENRRLFVYMSGIQDFDFVRMYKRLYRSEGDGQNRFADDLTLATEQLNDNDGFIELIRLLNFATQQEWERLLGMLEELASTLERRPDVSFSDAVMEELRWAFFERRLASTSVGPSAWRNATGLTSSRGGMAEERYKQLSQVRTRIAAAAESIGPTDESSALVRLASLLQNEHREHPDRSELPLMFSRFDDQAYLRPDQWDWI